MADFLCYDRIIVEVKAIKKITEIEEAQLLNYLTATKLPLGLIVNFGAPKLEWKRYVNTKKPLMNANEHEVSKRFISVNSRVFAVNKGDK